MQQFGLQDLHHGPQGNTTPMGFAVGANGPSDPQGNVGVKGPFLNGPTIQYVKPHPIFDIYKDSPIKFNFHILSLPHVYTSDVHISCAYTQKLVKFMDMFAGRGHNIYHYGNEGSVVPEGVEHIQILTEAERNKFGFAPGPFDTAACGLLEWDPCKIYWRTFGLRAASHLIHRAQQGDFVLVVGGGHTCYKFALEQFPGCNKYGSSNVILCDIGCGHYGSDIDFTAYESSTWREHIHGCKNMKHENYCDAVIPNYFDTNDFRFGIDPDERDERIIEIQKKPYYLFIGRIIELKRWQIAVDVTRELGVNLVLAGQGDPGKLPPHVYHFGLANKAQRKSLYAGAIATFVPTQYLSPLEGVSIESNLSGTPSITSDQGSFCENNDEMFRCATLREFIEAAKYAQTLTTTERLAIQAKAQAKFSLEAVRPLFERWFHRLWLLRHNGWDEKRGWDELIQR
jgi:glycosyltransferase involved in cell wall biosynthesis